MLRIFIVLFSDFKNVFYIEFMIESEIIQALSFKCILKQQSHFTVLHFTFVLYKINSAADQIICYTRVHCTRLMYRQTLGLQRLERFFACSRDPAFPLSSINFLSPAKSLVPLCDKILEHKRHISPTQGISRAHTHIYKRAPLHALMIPF